MITGGEMGLGRGKTDGGGGEVSLIGDFFVLTICGKK